MPATAFQNNVTIITGASLGIGAAIAQQLAEQGALLALASRDDEKLEQVARVCRACGGQAIVVPTDVSDPEQCRALIQRTVDKYGRIDTLVNNAGVTMFVLFEDVVNLDLFDRLMHINYLGSVYCTYYALPYMKQTHGRIVAISSVTGKTGVPTRTGYAATKHAMVGFFDSLRIEIARYGISVLVAYPDVIATGIRARALGPDATPVGKSTMQEDKAMPVDHCARMIVQGMAGRKREVVTSSRIKFGQWLKLIAPGVVDRMASKAIQTGR